MKVRGILIDVSRNKVEEREVEECSLDDLYGILNCSTIDIVVRTIGGKPFDIVCDDEGLLKENPIVTAISEKGDHMLVGNLFICNHNKDRLASLNDDDIFHIMNNMSTSVFIYRHSGKITIFPTLVNVGYAR